MKTKYLLIFFALFALLSCDNNDDNNRNTDTIEIPDEVNMDLLMGTWNFRGEGIYDDFFPGYHNVVVSEVGLECVYQGYLKFNPSDNTFTQVSYNYNGYDNSCSPKYYTGTFSVSGKTFILNFIRYGQAVSVTYQVKRLYQNKLEIIQPSWSEENRSSLNVTYYER